MRSPAARLNGNPLGGFSFRALPAYDLAVYFQIGLCNTFSQGAVFTGLYQAIVCRTFHFEQKFMLTVVRLGEPVDVEAAVSVYERSNLAYRQGTWRNRAVSVERVSTHLRDPTSWFLVAYDGPAMIGMASAKPLRSEDGMGSVIPGGWFLSYLFVDPERWGEGIGGAILDAVLAEATLRHASRIHLRTHEDNKRAHRLYRSRGFSSTGRNADGQGEWAREM